MNQSYPQVERVYQTNQDRMWVRWGLPKEYVSQKVDIFDSFHPSLTLSSFVLDLLPLVKSLKSDKLWAENKSKSMWSLGQYLLNVHNFYVLMYYMYYKYII